VIPAAFLQDLIARVDVVEVIGRHVELRRGGANFMGLCPFHTEKSPSFSVSPGKQFFHCFGCGASGDAIRFLTELQGLSFVEAVRELAQGVGLSVPEEQVSDDERQRRDTLRQRRQSITGVLVKANDFYRLQLRRHSRAIDYLKGRGLTGASAARFGLGYAPPGWRQLASVFPAYDDPVLEEAGLVRRSDTNERADSAPAAAGDDGRGRYDWFRDRVMFPIRSVQGEIIGFGGRVLDDSKPKYMNSPETPVFSKGRELYGLFEARQAIRDKGLALVVEGYMDVVALAQNGFGNAVATLGTACTPDHVQKLFRFTDSVVFSFDGDAAGRRAAGRALEAALPHVNDLRSARFLFLPPEHDPDSFVRERGGEAFQALISTAVPLSRQLIDESAQGADLASPEGRARLLAQARPLWALLPDGALKRQLLGELARQGQLELAQLESLWKLVPAAASPAAAGLQRPFSVRRAEPAARGRRAPAASADLALRLLLRHSDWWQRLSGEDQALLLELDGSHGRAAAWLEQHVIEHGDAPWSVLLEAIVDEDWQGDAQRWLAAGAVDEEQSFADLQRIVHRLWLARLRDELAALIATLPAEGASDTAARESIIALNRRIEFHRLAEVDAAAIPGTRAV
jgi:DNA primase